jgi:hypothetical protein
MNAMYNRWKLVTAERWAIWHTLQVIQLLKKFPPPFVEPEGALQYTQEHAIGPYPGPLASTPHLSL